MAGGDGRNRPRRLAKIASGCARGLSLEILFARDTDPGDVADRDRRAEGAEP